MRFEKTNPIRRRIGVNSYLKGDYGNKPAFGTRKTNPITLSPQHCWGLKNEFEKTNPILEKVKSKKLKVKIL